MSTRRPEVVSAATRRVLDVLDGYTQFSWAILKTQCDRRGLAPDKLGDGDVAPLVEELATAVGRFTSPEKAKAVATTLRAAFPAR